MIFTTSLSFYYDIILLYHHFTVIYFLKQGFELSTFYIHRFKTDNVSKILNNKI